MHCATPAESADTDLAGLLDSAAALAERLMEDADTVAVFGRMSGAGPH